MFYLITYIIVLVLAKKLVFPKTYWAMLWLPMFIVGWTARILSPFACMFITRQPVLDNSKRVDLTGKKYLLQRDRLVWWLTWFDTDDNATDEYWYGVYDNTHLKTQEYYDTHKVYRWYCRMKWLQRNSAYTFNRKFFGLPKDTKLAWQYKGDKPLWFGKYNSINIGWKLHRGDKTERYMFAGRLLGIRDIIK